MTLTEFNTQLSQMEAVLVGMYKQKTLLTAARENSRFKYVTEMKSKWNSLLQAIMLQTYNAGDSTKGMVLGSIMGAIQKGLPMTDFAGNPSDGWINVNPGSPGTGGGVPNAGFLSPITDILVKPFNGPTNPDQRTAFEIYALPWWDESTDTIMARWFLSPTRLNYPGTSFTLPLNLEWAKAYFSGDGRVGPNLEANFDFANQAITQTYSVGNIQSILADMSAVLYDVVSKTQKILELQVQINAAEKNLSDFVGSYAQFGSALNIAQILADLKAQAETAALAPPPPVPVAQVLTDQVPITVVPPASKLPWILGAAAIALLTIGGKKS